MEIYNNLPNKILDDAFISMQLCMNKILENYGGNRYNIPHINKDRLQQAGTYPDHIKVIDSAKDFFCCWLQIENIFPHLHQKTKIFPHLHISLLIKLKKTTEKTKKHKNKNKNYKMNTIVIQAKTGS